MLVEVGNVSDVEICGGLVNLPRLCETGVPYRVIIAFQRV